MNRPVETRVIRWTASGYEDSFTQYQIFADGNVWISQFALRDNIALALGSHAPERVPCVTLDNARDFVQTLIDNRADYTVEVEY